MKIRASRAAALAAASVLTALAPSQAFAAPQAPPCTKENIAYLDAQNTQDDAEAKITAAEQALDRARADRATVSEAQEKASAIREYVRSFHDGKSPVPLYKVADEFYALSSADLEHDPAAAADASVAVADGVDKAIVGVDIREDEAAQVRSMTSDLRTYSETVRKATEAPNVEARQRDLDKARTEQTTAHSKVRPARDAYRTCLDNLA
ncbi:hypothetical protein [Streptomyces sp. NPDC002526]